MSRLAQLNNRFYDSIRHRSSAGAAEGKATAQGFGHLKGHDYCLIVSYRRNGEPVPTPVWFGVDDEGRLYFRTDPDSAKVRRIRSNPQVRVAPCTLRGRPRGPTAEGRARVLSADEVPHAEAAIQAEYGIGRKIYESGSDRVLEAVYVEVEPVPPEGAPSNREAGS